MAFFPLFLGILALVVVLATRAAHGADPGTVVWNGTADAGLSVWDQVQDGTCGCGVGNTLISVVPSPDAYGLPDRKAYRFQVNSLDASGGPRAELANLAPLNEGEEWWFGDVLYIPSVPNKAIGWADGNHTLMQFKQGGGGSPPLELEFRPGLGGLLVDYNGSYRVVLSTDQVYDHPLEIEWRVRFSSSNGSFELWINGTRMLAVNGLATMGGGSSYFKEGQYGPSRGNVTYWLGVKKGTGRDAVATVLPTPAPPAPPAPVAAPVAAATTPTTTPTATPAATASTASVKKTRHKHKKKSKAEKLATTARAYAAAVMTPGHFGPLGP